MESAHLILEDDKPNVTLKEATRRACLPAQAGIEGLFLTFRTEILDIDALPLSVQG